MAKRLQTKETENEELMQKVKTLMNQNGSLNTEKDSLLRQLAEVKSELAEMLKENKF